MNNPNCDVRTPLCLPKWAGVRILPLSTRPGNSSNLHLCRACFQVEMNWRIEQNKRLSKESQFKIPSWESLEVCDGE